jgi:hypothetical protein
MRGDLQRNSAMSSGVIKRNSMRVAHVSVRPFAMMQALLFFVSGSEIPPFSKSTGTRTLGRLALNSSWSPLYVACTDTIDRFLLHSAGFWYFLEILSTILHQEIRYLLCRNVPSNKHAACLCLPKRRKEFQRCQSVWTQTSVCTVYIHNHLKSDHQQIRAPIPTTILYLIHIDVRVPIVGYREFRLVADGTPSGLAHFLCFIVNDFVQTGNI